jgi:hypothetical protein
MHMATFDSTTDIGWLVLRRPYVSSTGLAWEFRSGPRLPFSRCPMIGLT